MVYIVHRCEGAKKAVSAKRTYVDSKNSTAQLGSCFAHLNEGKIITQPKPSDDKIVIGYTEQGLPFQIVVDGFYGNGMAEHIHWFIDEYVVTLIDEYAINLAAGSEKTNDEKTKEIIKQIYALRKKHARNAEFTMSIAVTYEMGGKKWSSGFGIGDTGIVIKRKKNGNIEQLVANTVVNIKTEQLEKDIVAVNRDVYKDAFDRFCSEQDLIDLIISRNSIFTTEVDIGDELVGYTYVHEGLEKIAKQFDTAGYKKNQKGEIEHFIINTALIEANSEASLYDNLIESNKKESKRLIEEANAHSSSIKMGDDEAFGQMIIPDPLLQNKLKKENLVSHLYHSYLRDLEEAANVIIDSDIHQAIRTVIAQIEDLQRNGASCDSLIDVLVSTNNLLHVKFHERKSELKRYQTIIDKVQEHLSLRHQALSLAMLKLGGLMAMATGVVLTLGTNLLMFGGATAGGLLLYAYGRQQSLLSSIENLSPIATDKKNGLAPQQINQNRAEKP